MDRRGRHPGASTIVEALVGLALFSFLSVVLWNLFGNFVARGSRMSVVGGASRALVQQQTRVALRKLFHRLEEGIQVLEPVPGRTADAIVFRDLLNRTIRLRHDPVQHALLAERQEGTGWIPESDGDADAQLVLPIRVSFCDHVVFTALSPTAVVVGFTSSDSQIADSFLSVLHLRNSRLGP